MKREIDAALRSTVTALLVLLLLGACGDNDPVGADGRVPPTPGPATITALWGEYQEGKVNPAWYGALSGNFGVRVTDAAGQALEDVEVRWQVTSGTGFVGTFMDRTFLTDANGVGVAAFQATDIGTATVTATAAGLESHPLTFTVDVSAVVIGFLNHWPWTRGSNCDFEDTSDILYYGFAAGPTDGPNATVALGSPVEFEPHFVCPGHIVATVVPPGGEAFDAWVGPGVFRFVPNVAGTWEFVDQVSGSVGTLTAR
jgi:hypothetical protein